MDQMLNKLSESNTNRQSGEIYTIRTKISRSWLGIKKSSKEKKRKNRKGNNRIRGKNKNKVSQSIRKQACGKKTRQKKQNKRAGKSKTIRKRVNEELTHA